MIKKFIFTSLFIFLLIGNCFAALIDSYSETNQDTDTDLYSGRSPRGQAITLASNTDITSVKLYLRKFGSPTGTMTFKLYASTGTVGTNAVPTGSALATSGTYDVSTLTTSFALIELTFSPAYSASAGDICIGASYDGGDASNLVQIGADGTTPTHGGNFFFWNGSAYVANSGVDVCFYLYGNVVAAPSGQIIWID